MVKKRKRNYINNPEFYEAMKVWKEEYQKRIDEGKDPPIIPKYIAECFYHIANRYSYKPNFINYSFRDDMIADGIENCLMAAKNFNPEKYNNPFAYFTRCVHNAFIRRIQKEKKELYVKHKVIENSVLTGSAVENSDTSDNGSPEYIDLNNDYMNDFVENYERSMEEKKAKAQANLKKKEGLELLMEDENENSDN